MTAMGIMNHNAVIATTWSAEVAERLDEWIACIPDDSSPFTKSPVVMNGIRTFVLWPDGSKEGWEESKGGDELRAALIDRLGEDDYEDGSSPWCWIEVGFGEYGQKVLRGNCKNVHGDSEYALDPQESPA